MLSVPTLKMNKESGVPKKKYIVTLTSEERSYLRGLISKGKTAALKQRYARILLKTDQGPEGKGWTDEEIQYALDVHPSTVERLRKRCGQGRPESSPQA